MQLGTKQAYKAQIRQKNHPAVLPSRTYEAPLCFQISKLRFADHEEASAVRGCPEAADGATSERIRGH